MDDLSWVPPVCLVIGLSFIIMSWFARTQDGNRTTFQIGVIWIGAAIGAGIAWAMTRGYL